MLAPEGMDFPLIVISPFNSAASTGDQESKMNETIKNVVESLVFFISMWTFLSLRGIAVFFGIGHSRLHPYIYSRMWGGNLMFLKPYTALFMAILQGSFYSIFWFDEIPTNSAKKCNACGEA